MNRIPEHQKLCTLPAVITAMMYLNVISLLIRLQSGAQPKVKTSWVSPTNATMHCSWIMPRSNFSATITLKFPRYHSPHRAKRVAATNSNSLGSWMPNPCGEGRGAAPTKKIGSKPLLSKHNIRWHAAELAASIFELGHFASSRIGCSYLTNAK